MANHQLPMRTGVGIIVLNNNNQVFVGKRKDNPGDKWQMPQGGVDKGEDFITAMRRELIEETSIKNIKILKEIQNKLFNKKFIIRQMQVGKNKNYIRRSKYPAVDTFIILCTPLASFNQLENLSSPKADKSPLASLYIE